MNYGGPVDLSARFGRPETMMQPSMSKTALSSAGSCGPRALQHVAGGYLLGGRPIRRMKSSKACELFAWRAEDPLPPRADNKLGNAPYRLLHRRDGFRSDLGAFAFGAAERRDLHRALDALPNCSGIVCAPSEETGRANESRTSTRGGYAAAAAAAAAAKRFIQTRERAIDLTAAIGFFSKLEGLLFNVGALCQRCWLSLTRPKPIQVPPEVGAARQFACN